MTTHALQMLTTQPYKETCCKYNYLFVCVVSICTNCCQTDENVFLICWCCFCLHVFSEVAARWALSATLVYRSNGLVCFNTKSTLFKYFHFKMFQLHLFINYEITKILTFKIRVYILKCFFLRNTWLLIINKHKTHSDTKHNSCPSMCGRQRRLWWTSGETLLTTPHWPSTARLCRESAALNSWGCTSQRTSPGPPTPCQSPRRHNSA